MFEFEQIEQKRQDFSKQYFGLKVVKDTKQPFQELYLLLIIVIGYILQIPDGQDQFVIQPLGAT